MKKIVYLFIICASSARLMAQFPAEPDREKFGFRVGGYYSLMNFNKGVPKPASKIKNTWRPGMNARMLLQIYVTKTFRLQPEYALAFMNGKDASIEATYKLMYMSLPVLARFNVSRSFAIIAGPQFDLLIQAKETADRYEMNITRDTEERSVSATVGLEYSFSNLIYMDARYIHGLNHVGLGQRSAIKEYKWQNVDVGIGVRF